MKAFVFFGAMLSLCACSSPDKAEHHERNSLDSAQWLVDASINAHGFDAIQNKTFQFDFRDMAYTAIYSDDGSYLFTRTFSNKEGARINDSLTNTGFSRHMNGIRQEIDDEWKGKYSASINSVMYFSFLPYRLNDEAVIKTYLGLRKYKNGMYHLLQIQFKEEGGGEDFEDRYVYWINQESKLVDYLAYNYRVNEGGVRFREAFNRKNFAGFKLNQYKNYQCDNLEVSLETLLDSLHANKLDLLSLIENVNIRVE